jgi:hypothetical protein
MEIDVYWKSCLLNVAKHSADGFGTYAGSRSDCKCKRCLFVCLFVYVSALKSYAGVKSFFPSALDADEWSASRPGRSVLRGKDPPVRIGYTANWSSENFWTIYRKEQSVTVTDIGQQMLGCPFLDVVAVLNILPRLTSQTDDLHKRPSLF